MANKRKIAAVVGAMALTAVVAVGGTLAYLSSVTEVAKNKFVGSKGITGEIVEEDWAYGDTGWTDFLPGSKTGKNPKIEIKGNVETYVAMKLECVDGKGEKIGFDEFITKYAKVLYNNTDGINATNWEKDSNGFYIYKGSLAGNTTSAELFDEVQILMGIVKKYENTTGTKTVKVYTVHEDGSKTLKETVTGTEVLVGEKEEAYLMVDGKEVLVDNGFVLPSFEINVQGYAIQKAGNEAVYKTELRELAGL